jgi:hypothetical protein
MGLIRPWVISIGPQIQGPSPRTQGKPRTRPMGWPLAGTRGPWGPIARSKNIFQDFFDIFAGFLDNDFYSFYLTYSSITFFLK